jgi:hypothetical protein
MRFMTKKIIKIVPVIKPEVRIVFAEKKIQSKRFTRIKSYISMLLRRRSCKVEQKRNQLGDRGKQREQCQSIRENLDWRVKGSQDKQRRG